jgi:hypothetical protein
MQSQLCDKYANVSLYYIDGVSDMVCQIIGINGRQYDVITQHGVSHKIDISQIKNLINVTNIPLYSIGQRILANIILNQFDGYQRMVCEILSVSQFCNDIKYCVRELKEKKNHYILQSDIYCLSPIEPIYEINNYVGVQYDTYIKNGRIVSIKKENDIYKYLIKFDDGVISEINEQFLTKSKYKTQEEREQDQQLFIISEEKRLLDQLNRS